MTAVLSRRALIALLALGLPAAASANPGLLEQLRAGGRIILLRHARTVPGTGDPPGFRLEDCATQRNLSEGGQAQARAIGEALRRERVPVDRVLSSRWCRCLDTARLLGLGKVEPFEPLNSFFEERGQQEAQTRAVRERMAAWRGPGNLMMVTHQVNITAASRVYPASGEAVVMEPGGAVLGRLKLG